MKRQGVRVSRKLLSAAVMSLSVVAGAVAVKAWVSPAVKVPSAKVRVSPVPGSSTLPLAGRARSPRSVPSRVTRYAASAAFRLPPLLVMVTSTSAASEGCPATVIALVPVPVFVTAETVPLTLLGTRMPSTGLLSTRATASADGSSPLPNAFCTSVRRERRVGTPISPALETPSLTCRPAPLGVIRPRLPSSNLTVTFGASVIRSRSVQSPRGRRQTPLG